HSPYRLDAWLPDTRRREFLPQLLHMHVHRARVSRKVVAPHEVEQLAALKDTAGVARQQGQQVELLGSELNLGELVPDLVALEVHLQLAGADQLRRVRLDTRPPQEGFGSRDQLLGMKGLGQVVVR